MNEREKHGCQRTSKQRPAVLVRLYDTVSTLHEHILSSAQDASGLHEELLRPDDDIEYAQVLLDTYVCAVGCDALPKLALPTWPQESSCSMVEVRHGMSSYCAGSYYPASQPWSCGAHTRVARQLLSPLANQHTPTHEPTLCIVPPLSRPCSLLADSQNTPSISKYTFKLPAHEHALCELYGTSLPCRTGAVPRGGHPGAHQQRQRAAERLPEGDWKLPGGGPERRRVHLVALAFSVRGAGC